MSAAPQLILHVGAPKCGSTALQSALSMTPDLMDQAGRKLRYTSWCRIGSSGRALYGPDVTLTARLSPYGYVSWPDFRAGDDGAVVLAGLDEVRRKGLSEGHVPIASCEGWISRVERFAPQLARWGHPPIEVVALLRPVVSWTNSAFWQWGVWSAPDIGTWLHRGHLPYRFGIELEAWASIPNVKVRFGWAQPDAVAQFARWQGVCLPPASTQNTSSSAPLLGVLLRNRQLRPNGHDAATEFVVQRWCPPIAGRGLWAIGPRHAHQLRPVTQRNLAALRRAAADAGMRKMCEDPRWVEESPFHPEIRAGASPLSDPAQLAGLHASLCIGLERLFKASGITQPQVPPCPGPHAELAEWDAALVAMLDMLLKQDRARRERLRRSMAGTRLRLGRMLDHAHHHLFNRSR